MNGGKDRKNFNHKGHKGTQRKIGKSRHREIGEQSLPRMDADDRGSGNRKIENIEDHEQTQRSSGHRQYELATIELNGQVAKSQAEASS